MSVYVDCARHTLGRMVMSHMVADTAVELHEMAQKIGMRAHWYQAPDAPRPASFPHYDLSQMRRRSAIKHGAIIIGRHELADIMRSIRAHMIDCDQFAASWRFAEARYG